MNIYDIAEKCGVSIATVSRVLNNNPNVSAATRERILAVINEANYTPSALARRLGTGDDSGEAVAAPLSAVGVCLAIFYKRTAFTPPHRRRADKRAKLHERLREIGTRHPFFGVNFFEFFL